MRYAVDSSHVDGLPPGEGCFLACTFWLADNLMLAGRLDEATALFERLLSLTNDVGLLSEEYDPVGQRLLGNFPQAFSHVSLVNTAHNLTQGAAQARAPGRCGIVRRVSWPERPVIHEVNTWPWLHDLAERAGRDGHAGHRSARGVGRPLRSRCRRRLVDGRVGAQSGQPPDRTGRRQQPGLVPSRPPGPRRRRPTSPVRPTACAGSWPTSASAAPRASPWPAPSSATAACACCSTSCPTTSPRTTRGPRSTPSTSCPAPTGPATPPAATRTSRRGTTRCSSTPSRSPLRTAAADTVLDIAEQCDGVRCDMAMLLLNRIFAQTWGERVGWPPPTEYWTDVIGAVRAVAPRLRLHGRGVLGPGARAPAARLRLLLRQAALRPARVGRRAVDPRPPPRRSRLPAPPAAVHREPRRAARGGHVRARPGAGGGRRHRHAAGRHALVRGPVRRPAGPAARLPHPPAPRGGGPGAARLLPEPAGQQRAGRATGSGATSSGGPTTRAPSTCCRGRGATARRRSAGRRQLEPGAGPGPDHARLGRSAAAARGRSPTCSPARATTATAASSPGVVSTSSARAGALTSSG